MKQETEDFDVIIIGAGAAGLMCAAEAGKRGRRVLVLDHADKIGEKIRISGGGRCNFTNTGTHPSRFLSQNPHFCKSALSRYTPQDFIDLLAQHNISWHEKTLGQLFCDNSARDIVNMLLKETAAAGAIIRLETKITAINKLEDGFFIETNKGPYTCEKLVIATGGPSIPKIGASGFGYRIAQQFGLNVIPPYAALVPFTLDEKTLETLKPLVGVAVDPVVVKCAGTSFREAMLFTHRGLSGPAILQISSYWQKDKPITIDFCPDHDMTNLLKQARKSQPRKAVHNIIAEMIPSRLAEFFVATTGYQGIMADCPDKKIEELSRLIKDWQIVPSGTEGYRTAEVAGGGVDTDELSSKTFEARKVPGLYFIGEVVDVTGWLGGYNFQWAWASGWCCGQDV
ncbi:MAG: NAD(P)/FAD-dependent oxidoreductase [Micavibrio sp.]